MLSLLVIAINVFFVLDSVINDPNKHIILLMGLGLYSVIYIIMCIYLMLHMLMSMGCCKDIANSRVSLANYTYLLITLNFRHHVKCRKV